jgi:uncharacterized membrane-anchored protein YhcB (DUF1043 family)
MPDFLTKLIEHLWAPFAALFTIIGILLGYIWKRHEKESDGKSQKLDEHIEETTKRFGDLNVRMTHLEADYVKRPFVEEVVKNVKADFHSDHSNLAKNLKEDIVESEARMKETVAQCNQALRSEIGVLHTAFSEQMVSHSKMLVRIIDILDEKRDARRRDD